MQWPQENIVCNSGRLQSCNGGSHHVLADVAGAIIDPSAQLNEDDSGYSYDSSDNPTPFKTLVKD
jgi:hypothetical protein